MGEQAEKKCESPEAMHRGWESHAVGGRDVCRIGESETQQQKEEISREARSCKIKVKPRRRTEKDEEELGNDTSGKTSVTREGQKQDLPRIGKSQRRKERTEVR